MARATATPSRPPKRGIRSCSLAAATVKQHPENEAGREGRQRRGERPLLDLVADLLRFLAHFAPHLFGRFLRLTLGLRHAAIGDGADIRGHFGEISTELLEVGLQRREVGLEACGHGDPHRLRRKPNARHAQRFKRWPQPISTALPITLRSITACTASAARSNGKRCEMRGFSLPWPASSTSSLVLARPISGLCSVTPPRRTPMTSRHLIS